MSARFRVSALVVAWLSCGSVWAAAQEPGSSTRWDAAQLHTSRAELEDLLAKFQQAAGSSAYSPELRQRARSEAGLVEKRLREGDFQVGDQIVLRVEAAGQQLLSDSFVVVTGRSLRIPNLGEIPLTGVLRSELQPYLTEQLKQYIRDPLVRTQSLMRIMVMGSVARPGYFTVPSETPITDILMGTGAPNATANLTAVRIERGERPIWQGEALQQAITEGRTLDQLSLQAGDRIVVPERRRRIGWLGVVSAASSITFLLLRLGRIL